MDFDDLHDLADDRPNDRPELSSPNVDTYLYAMDIMDIDGAFH